MNKGELVDSIAERSGTTKKQADAILNALTEAIVDTVSSGEKVTLIGFGNFEARYRKVLDQTFLVHSLCRLS